MARPNGSERVWASLGVLIAAIVLTITTILWLEWQAYAAYRAITTIADRELRVTELRGTIAHLDEVLTMSARMAATTGQPHWEARYRRFEPQLDAAIKEAIRLAPEAYSGEAAAQTDAANLKLVEMETRALELVREGRLPEAQAVVFSEAYDAQKRLYADGMEWFVTLLTQRVDGALDTERRRAFGSLAAMVVVLPLLSLAWLWILLTHQRRERAVRLSREQLSRQADQLSQLTESLDRKVAERTAELSRLNVTLQREVAERANAQQALEAKMRELERLNRIMMGREERILELKEEVRRLQAQPAPTPPPSS